MNAIPQIRDIEKLLSGAFESRWKYLNYTAKYLTAPGENYGSTILSVDIEYEDGNKKVLHLVAKLCPTNELIKEAFLTSITFKKEYNSYIQLYPALEKFQEDNKISETKRLGVFAKCFGARLSLVNNNEVDNDAVILLENLKSKDYIMEDRLNGVNLETAQLILQNLARLHASIIALKLSKPQEFREKVMPALVTVNNGGIMVDGFVDSAVYMAKTIKECEPYLKRFESALEKGRTIGGMEFPVKTNLNFFTMIHADFWTNNIMIQKNSDGKPTKVKIVDLQLLDYGTAIRDLLFFIYSSVQIEVCQQYFDYLIKMYYESFIECLSDFKCDLTDFSWELFIREINDVAPHEFFHIIFMLKPIFSERGTVEHLDNIDVKTFARTDNLGKFYVEKLKQIVFSFAEKGWI